MQSKASSSILITVLRGSDGLDYIVCCILAMLSEHLFISL